MYLPRAALIPAKSGPVSMSNLSQLEEDTSRWIDAPPSLASSRRPDRTGGAETEDGGARRRGRTGGATQSFQEKKIFEKIGMFPVTFSFPNRWIPKPGIACKCGLASSASAYTGRFVSILLDVQGCEARSTLDFNRSQSRSLVIHPPNPSIYYED